jgi:hypothetical protein
VETAVVLTSCLIPVLAASAYYLEDHRAAVAARPAEGPAEATIPTQVIPEQPVPDKLVVED